MRRALVIGALLLALLAWTAFWPSWAFEAAFAGVSREASPAQVERRILTAFGSARGPRAVRIARCESRTPRRPLDPRAVGAAGERGLFQIHPGHWRGPRPWTPWIAAIVHQHGEDALFDVDTNIRIAYRMSRGGLRWVPWTCARKVA